jgi:osmotically-inducible protein OsmY
MRRVGVFFIALFLGMFLLYIADLSIPGRNLGRAVDDALRASVLRTIGTASVGAQDLGYRARYALENVFTRVQYTLGQVDQVFVDASITAAVRMKIARQDLSSKNDILVQTSNGVVTLKGRVNSQVEAEHAVHLAQQAEGVNRVISELRVEAVS